MNLDLYAKRELTKKRILQLTQVIVLLSIIDEIHRGSSPTIILLDIVMSILLVLYIYVKPISEHKYFHKILFFVFPIIYIPLAWINTNGIYGAGLLYFFLFITIIIYANPNKSGIICSSFITVELMILIFIDYLNPDFISVQTQSNNILYMYLCNLPIVTGGILLILYNIINKNFDLNKKLYDSSITDSLTGFYNRGFLISYLENAIVNYNPIENSLHIAFMDIDHLKQINDKYGHIIGDSTIEIFADSVKSSVKSTDIVSRVGGDEFIMLAENTSYENFLKVINRIEGDFSKNTKSELGFTAHISIGVTTYSSGSVDQLINEADKIMYKVKSRNKNDRDK